MRQAVSDANANSPVADEIVFDFGDGPNQIMLEEDHLKGWKTGELSSPLGRGVNFQIEVEDLRPLLDRLAKAKHALYREPKDEWYPTSTGLEGQREFLVTRKRIVCRRALHRIHASCLRITIRVQWCVTTTIGATGWTQTIPTTV